MRHTIALAMSVLLASSRAQADQVGTPPGEGVLCSLAISTGLAEVGRRCFPNQDAAFQAVLAESATKLERYVLANSSMSVDDLRKFEDQQAEPDEPAARRCMGEGARFYRHLRDRADLAKLRAETDRVVARPGTPTWGDCL